MASLDILNLDCFTTSPKREKWYNDALGFSVGDDDQGMYNGGIVNPQREHLKVGHYYFRLISGSQPASRNFGPWWMDFETLNNIYQRFAVTGDNRKLASSGHASSVFREWLALTYSWNRIEKVVVARLEARLDCYSGVGRLAQGASSKDFRRLGYAPHLSVMFNIKQLCVPEIWLHAKTAMPKVTTHSFNRIEDIVRGRLR